MLKHAAQPSQNSTAPNTAAASSDISEKKESPIIAAKDTSPAAMRELLEKNLKWSQIIYEQNRKINNKLLWAAVASWLRFLIILVPLALALWYLPAILRELRTKYGLFLDAAAKGQLSPASVNNLLDVLPVNSVERAQLKAMLQPASSSQK